jgi:hypothetical protein
MSIIHLDLLQQTSQDSVDLQKCNVLHDYKPRRSDEMQLIKGEELFVIDKSADGWWKGQVFNLM